jgi:serine/threonine protein kinase
MSPEQVQSQELTNRSDLYSLGAVMYELLTGTRPFRAGNLAKLMHQIVYATPAPIHTLRSEVTEELENVVAMALQKDPDKRYRSGLDLAAALTRVHQKLRTRTDQMEQTEQMALLRKLKFFHDFSQAEIGEVLKASSWQNYSVEEEIVREGDMDDRFYVVVAGNCVVQRNGRKVGAIGTGDCFGESSYVPGARRSASVRTSGNVTLLKVGATLLEQASASCQLRFNRVFLRSLIERLQKSEQATAGAQ